MTKFKVRVIIEAELEANDGLTVANNMKSLLPQQLGGTGYIQAVFPLMNGRIVSWKIQEVMEEKKL